ncbi:AAA family ATPase [Phenylobacterium sp. LjRoot219]|uniref:ATP-binding protein n=1 Tax=Phenylobacterium sp. LjRoot219 TaxID=3342283 RepID=UPI003ECEED28
MRPGPTLIIFGISGVGKTTAAQAMLDRFAGLRHFQASSLLKAAHAQSGEELRTAPAERIAENQTVLSRALADARSGSPGAPAILDAHSVIDNDRGLVDLPLQTFAALEPDAIAFLRADPNAIVARRLSDARHRPARSAAQLAAYQDRAEMVAAAHARALGIPFQVVEGGDHETLARFLADALHLNTPEPRGRL